MSNARNPKFEATFELARNVTVAAALAGFAAWAGHSPRLPYPEGPPQLLIYLANGFSGIWIGLSCERFVSIWRESGGGKSLWAGIMLGAVAIFAGFSAIVAANGLAAGNAIGVACERAMGVEGEHAELIRSSERCARYFSELEKAELRAVFE